MTGMKDERKHLSMSTRVSKNRSRKAQRDYLKFENFFWVKSFRAEIHRCLEFNGDWTSILLGCLEDIKVAKVANFLSTKFYPDPRNRSVIEENLKKFIEEELSVIQSVKGKLTDLEFVKYLNSLFIDFLIFSKPMGNINVSPIRTEHVTTDKIALAIAMDECYWDAAEELDF